MSELVLVQEQFQAFIMKGQADIESSIVQTEQVSVDKRLAIYRDAYQLRLIESLSTSFPALHAYLGTEAFETLCRFYLKEHPSTLRSIRWFGDRLAELMRTYYEVSYSFLAELADLEWRMTLSFDAADKERVQEREVAQVPPESWSALCFLVHPSVQRMNYQWNTLALWQALTQDQALPEMQHQEKKTPWVLWRLPDYRIQYYSLSDEEAWALDALMAGSSFQELCEGLCEWVTPEEVGMRAATYLKKWIQMGLLAELQF